MRKEIQTYEFLKRYLKIMAPQRNENFRVAMSSNEMGYRSEFG